MHSPSLEFATAISALPSDFRTGHAILDLHTAQKLGFADRLWSKWSAVRLAMLAAFERAESQGQGTKAAKRGAEISTAQWYDDLRLTIEDVERLAESHQIDFRDL